MSVEREHSCAIAPWCLSQTHTSFTLMMSNEGAGNFITSFPSHRQPEAVTGWGFVFKEGELLWVRAALCVTLLLPKCLCADLLSLDRFFRRNTSLHPSSDPKLSQQPGVETVSVTKTWKTSKNCWHFLQIFSKERTFQLLLRRVSLVQTGCQMEYGKKQKR